MALPNNIRDEIIDLLMRGDHIPLEYQRFLFPPERREYELVYGGKEREADILADTMAVPFQPVRTFGAASPDASDWRNMLIFGDNLQAMKTLLMMKKRGELKNPSGSEGVRFVYIDPPFATRQFFSGDQEQKAYRDKVAGAQFLEFLRKRLVLIRELLSNDGLLVLHIDYRYGHYLKVLLDEIFPGGFRNEIKVPRGTKNVQNQFKEITALTVGDDSLYLYAKSSSTKLPHLRLELDEDADGKWDTFWRGTDRVTMRYPLFGKEPGTGQWRWKKSRAYEAKENYEIYLQEFSSTQSLDEYYLRELEEGNKLNFIRLNDDGVVQYFIPPRSSRILSTIWTHVRTLGKVTNYPTEKHEELIWTLVEWLTSPDDLVMDAFSGSGTTPAVSEKLGRRWIAIDSGKLAVHTIQKRMLGLKTEIGNKGKPLVAKPFDLCNAGLYDFATLKTLPWKDWRFFALALFECRDEPHVVNGLTLDGKRRGASVLVFNHHERPGQRVDEEFVQNIHEIVSGRVSDEFCIVAPKAVFDFQQDYLEMDGVRYYALRIPYSFISELHRRSFSALKQPSSEADVNGLVDSYGFDFIVRPTFAFETGIVTHGKGLFTEAYLKITQFQSHSKIKGAETGDGKEALSMLMLDFDYDGEVFDFDAVFYAHQLATADWTARFAEENLGEKMMAVFIDIHGNEAQEVIGREQFAPVVEMNGAETSEKE